MTAITLRFDTPWLNAKSPITIRFNDDHIPELPDPPIRIGSIGMACGLAILTGQSIKQQITLSTRSQSHGTHALFAWESILLKQQISMLWNASPPLAGEVFAIEWQWNTLVPFQLDMNWLVPQPHGHQAMSNWIVPELQQKMLEMQWSQAAAKSQQITVKLHIGEQLATEIALSYTNIQSQGDNKTVAWAPHAARWVCSSKYVPPVGKVTLRFSKPLINSTSPTRLRFTASPNVCYWDDGGGLIGTNPSLPTIDFKIPIEPQIRRSYLMQPQISCVRVSDGVAVVLKSVSISQSRSQWASSGSLAFSSRIDAERAANELLKISINGYDFYLLCESPSESKAFGKTSYSATGRGRLATLASPNRKATNYVNVVARTFIGLMADIVANTGWTVASKISDYPVPANAFSYAAKTPAEAINMMANSIGAMLDVNDETQTITVIPQWPVVPWNTASAIPDVILHDGVILEFNERLDIRPDANAVFVRGEQQGVAAKVKRFGTAGDNFAADIVDKLITDNQAARMRATAELANAGNKVQNSIRAKVMADLPPMRPGMLIGVRKGAEVFKSVCESFSISGSVNESTGMVTVNQTVTLLRNEVAA
ncbi:hypothetical protein [Shewanella oncorhynchi]|uniref:hypothetical protein n=1 Tax=Shewanella oncorhynchi TaxID=2726434 RepID=UPI002E7B5291|nr:hypothetical protein [Shewanella oncorhynchi]WVI91391.1 hypothetical protein VR487_11055 [Shewanella oncorhynchi]